MAKHKCETQIALAASRERGAARRARIDTTPKVCAHGGIHEHGTATMYRRDDCHCPACSAAYRVDRNLWYRDKRLKGTGGYLPVQPVEKHLNSLVTSMTRQDIAARSGVCLETISKVLNGHRKSVTQTTAEALLGVRPAPPKHNGYLPALGMQRRLQALVAEGWSVPYLADRLGINRRVLERELHGFRTKGYADTIRRVDALYRELSKQQAPLLPSGKGRWGRERYQQWARKQGWVPGAAWDDIDSPRERPKGVD